jgi:uncharacterized protein involved in exopolysaccharide biosynthesis
MSNQQSSTFWLFLEVLANRRKLILFTVISLTLISVIVAFALPQWYRAKALLLPPKSSSVMLSEYRGISEASSITEGMALPLMVTPSDIYARMLKSRKIADTIINRFNLMSRYEAEGREATYLALMSHSDFKVTEEGLLTVSVEDKDPVVSAQITNGFVEELDKTIREISLSQKKQSRQLLEGRLIDVEKALDSARHDLQQFQLAHKTVDFDQQTRLAVEQAINLKATLAAIETDLMVREKTLGSENTELVELKQRKQVVERQLKDLETKNRDSSFFSLAISEIPALRGQYEELYSRVKVNETLHSLLLEQRERAKIQENDDLSTISVVDTAVPPELRSRPWRTLIVLGTFGGSLILAVALATIAEYFRRLRLNNPDEYRRVSSVAEAFFGWLPGMKR